MQTNVDFWVRHWMHFTLRLMATRVKCYDLNLPPQALLCLFLSLFLITFQSAAWLSQYLLWSTDRPQICTKPSTSTCTTMPSSRLITWTRGPHTAAALRSLTGGNVTLEVGLWRWRMPLTPALYLSPAVIWPVTSLHCVVWMPATKPLLCLSHHYGPWFFWSRKPK